jgi:hypothetical protein
MVNEHNQNRVLVNVGTGAPLDQSEVVKPDTRDYRPAWVSDGSSIVIDPEKKRDILVALIRVEAERRIATGILVNSHPFRCDDQSLLRMLVLTMGLEEREEGYQQTFSTAAGQVMSVTAVEARAIYTAMVEWQGAVLAASALLQVAPPEDWGDDQHWPARSEVTLGS